MTKEKSARFVAEVLVIEVLKKYNLKPVDIMRAMVIILNPDQNDKMVCEIPVRKKKKEAILHEPECTS